MGSTNISWDNLRQWDNSVNRAFELLCGQLAEFEKIDDRDFFTATGNRDSGVECYWTLNNGDEIGWQAKYIRRAITTEELGQIDRSIKTAIAKHPRLIKYIICLPQDLDDPRIYNQASAKERWDNSVKKWEKWATKKGLKIEFILWGEHQILERLSRQENKGRRYFWFNENEFNDEWFAEHLEVQIPKAGHRYTQELSIDLPISKKLDAFVRKDTFYNTLNNYIDKLYKTSQDLNHLDYKFKPSKNFSKLLELVEDLQYDLKSEVQSKAFVKLDFKHDSKKIKQALKLVEEIRSKHRDRDNKYKILELDRILKELYYYFDEIEVKLANNNSLLLTGDAGMGKTHLLCDYAVKRSSEDQPTILLFGEDFYKADPWMQILNRLQLKCTKNEFLESLNTLGKLKECYVLFIIDALNEGDGKHIWKNELPSVLVSLKKFSHIKICISVRSDYKKAIIGNLIKTYNFVELAQQGFQGVEYKATKRFFDWYKIERPKIPLLVPEFSNPLFLKLFCIAISNSNDTIILNGETGISTIYSAFIDAINSKLSDFDRLDFDPQENLVQKTISKFADHKFQNSKSYLTREEAKNIIDGFLPDRGYEKSLFKNLLSEGVFKETIIYTDEGWFDAVDFAYERLSDFLVAKNIVEEFENQIGKETNLAEFLSAKDIFNNWKTGILQSLSILLPEKFGVELLDQIDKEKIPRAIDSFINSLVWRNTNSFTSRTNDLINTTIIQKNNRYLIWELFNAFLLVCSNPNHPYNSSWLNSYLRSYTFPKREKVWQTYLRYNYESESVIYRILDWSLSKHEKDNIDDKSIILYGIILCWFLSSTNRELRDKATIGIVNLFTTRAHLLKKLLRVFRDIDDPYVTERLYASTLGVVLSTNDEKSVISISNNIYETFFKSVPTTNILIRDYAKGIVEGASRFKPLSKEKIKKISPPYTSTWPKIITPLSELKKKDPKKNSNYKEEKWPLGRIFSSVLSDDFARYIIGTNWQTFDWKPYRIKNDKDDLQMLKEFTLTLTHRQAGFFFELIDISLALKNANRHIKSETIEYNNQSFSANELTNEKKKIENKFYRSLGKKKKTRYDEFLKRYLFFSTTRGVTFNLELAQRWILERIFDLGWNTNLHGKFDNSIDNFRNGNRIERIGKKYQWISYFEFLGLVSDHFIFDRTPAKKYLGTWQLSVRDIDPTLTIKKELTDLDEEAQPWWSNTEYNGWMKKGDWKIWLKDHSHIPNIPESLKAVNPKDDSEWYCLNKNLSWRKFFGKPEQAHSRDYQELWFSVQSFFIKTEDLETFKSWQRDNFFLKNWLPNSPEIYSLFLREFSQTTAYKNLVEEADCKTDWFEAKYGHPEQSLPFSILLPSITYLNEAQDYYRKSSMKIFVPINKLINDLSLTWEKEGCFNNRDKELTAYNPHLYEIGPRSFLINKKILDNYLKEKQLTLCWIVGGEKIEQQSARNGSGFYGRPFFRGHYFLNNELEMEGELKSKFSRYG